MDKKEVEYNLLHAKNLVINDPVALLFEEPYFSASKEELLETIRVLQLYLGKVIEVAEELNNKRQDKWIVTDNLLPNLDTLDG